MRRIFLMVWRIFTRRERRQVLLLTPAIVLSGVLQTIAMVSILPFLGLLSATDLKQGGRLVQWLIEAGIDSRERLLLILGVGALLLLAVSNAVAGITTWAQYRFSWMRNYSISTRLLSSYLEQPYPFFLNANSSDLVKTVLSETQSVVSGVIVNSMMLFAKITMVLFTIAVLITIDPILALVAAVSVGTLYGGLFWLVRRKLSDIGRLRVRVNSARFQAATELFGGIKEFKVLGIDDKILRRFKQPARQFSNYMAQAAVLTQVPRFALETIAFGSVIIMVLYLLATRGALADSLPMLGLYGFAALRLLPAVQTIFSAFANIRFNTAALETIYESMAPTPTGSGPCESSGRSVSFEREISFRDVSFAYPNSDEPVLNDISFNIAKGDWVAFVGPSGAGKSTIADIVLGLLSPTTGHLEIDGLSLDATDVASWQHHIGYVPQHIFLSDDTILRNIAFGVADDQIDRRAAIEAAQVAQIHDFIVHELPHGYDTNVGEHGARLSGGQRQRIGIARALYRDRSVLILDEATSALDGITEQRFFEALGEKRRDYTIIFIAHRMSTTRDCDTIIVLSNGSIAGTGRYDDLMKTNQTFVSLAGKSSKRSHKQTA